MSTFGRVRISLIAAALGCCIAPAVAQDAGVAPAVSKYGADDTIGALNLLGADDVLRAAKLITTGKTYELGGVTGPNTPAYGHRSFALYMTTEGFGGQPPMGRNLATAHDDLMTTWLGIGTQIDGFAHFGREHTYYNGATAAEVFSPTGARKFGTHEIPEIVTRGVLLDMVTHFKARDRLKAGQAFGENEIKSAAAAQGITIAQGDVVIFHTGWQAVAETNPAKFLGGQPGLDVDGADYLADLGVVAIGADTWGLEVLPNPDPALVFPVHGLLLAEHGIHILENIQTTELIADGVSEFMFVLGIPKFEGAVQMVVNPIAIR